MEFAELKKYKINGIFSYEPHESLKERCNAPYDNSGVYLIYKVVQGEEKLIYIGSSGLRNKEGNLKHRNGGMNDRLVNGYHPNRFGELKRIKRHKAFPKQMLVENIEKIKIYWWVTYDGEFSNFPTDVEARLKNLYLAKYGKLPDWHQK